MINQKDRDALVAYRLNQAFETIKLARFLSENQKFVIAVNRIYYGMYYALTALALTNSFETSKHSQLIGWFNKEFIAKKNQILNLVRVYETHSKTEQKVIMMHLVISPNKKLKS